MRQSKQPIKKAAKKCPVAIKQPEVPLHKIAETRGRKTNFDDPEEFVRAAYEYFEWCESNPIWTVEYLGKDAIRRDVPKRRVYTLSGLMLWCGGSESWLRVFLKDLKEGTRKKLGKKQQQAWLDAINFIKDCIKTQKIEGAAAGVFNANFLAREMGLWDKQRVEIDGELNGEIQHKITGPVVVEVRSSNVPLASAESEIETKK